MELENRPVVSKEKKLMELENRPVVSKEVSKGVG